MIPHRLLRVFGEQFRRTPYLVGFTAILAGLLVWAVIAPLPKRSIKHIIILARRAIETREVEGLRPLLAETFSSPHTGDREQTIERLREALQEVLSIKIKIKHIRIHVENDQATAVVEFYISGTIRGGDVYPQMPFRGLSGDATLANPLERCRVTFLKEADGRWRILGVELISAAAPDKASASS